MILPDNPHLCCPLPPHRVVYKISNYAEINGYLMGNFLYGGKKNLNSPVTTDGFFVWLSQF